jgi:hypothetical protein
MKEIFIAIISSGAITTFLSSIVTLISNKRLAKETCKKEDLEKEINKVQLDNCKNYLVQQISASDRRELSQAEKERYWENYDNYIKLGGNSYIHSETERLKKEGKI